ncbi:MAG: hypothetical protein FWG07_01830 [Treponema sp.]|nr:hypothetical protein [Treponema sp.]
MIFVKRAVSDIGQLPDFFSAPYHYGTLSHSPKTCYNAKHEYIYGERRSD